MGKRMSRAAQLMELYQSLLGHFGPQGWWPAQTPFEVMVGAMLTQNTNWDNVVKAIGNLRSRNLLDPHRLYAVPPELLEELLRPAGYFRVKAKRLRNLMRWLHENYAGDVEAIARRGAARNPRS